ncbi:MAG: SDR family NAD(P)-dependent oxidoreductase [Candidatus Syntropharchaeia archaeon]
MKLKDKVAIVTGAGRGIGRAIALKLAEEGADVVVSDIREKEASEVVKEIEKMGRKAMVSVTDVTNGDQVREMIKKTLDEFGKIDILVNNAGWDKIMLFKDTNEEFWDKIIAINYKGVLNTCKAVIEHMMERKYGKIINIASDAGRVGSLGEAVYSGAKGAVIAFTKTLAREMARYSVNVNCVCPGPTETPLVEELMEEKLGGKILGSMEKVVPLGRMAKPEEIAGPVAFLASDEAAFITGQTLSVSGGLTMV